MTATSRRNSNALSDSALGLFTILVILFVVNLGHGSLALSPGTKICQFVFEKCDGHAQYKGRFIGQIKP